MYFSSSYCYSAHLLSFIFQFQSCCCRLPNDFLFFNSSFNLFRRLNFFLSTPANFLSMAIFSACFFRFGSNPFSRSFIAICYNFSSFCCFLLHIFTIIQYVPISVVLLLLSSHQFQIILFFFSSLRCYL